jgi:hypothetical protein
MKIKTIDNKGLHITCSNGTVFSLQFGAGNYCSNYNNNISIQFKEKPDTESNDCEIAVFNKNGDWITENFFKDSDGQVAGYIPIDLALGIILKYESSLNSLRFTKED